MQQDKLRTELAEVERQLCLLQDMRSRTLVWLSLFIDRASLEVDLVAGLPRVTNTTARVVGAPKVKVFYIIIIII